MAEKSFADYVKDVMSVLPSVDRSNMLAPTTMSAEEMAAYRANPFYKQEEIRQRIAAEEAAKRTPTTPIPQGMMTGGGGDSFQGQQGAGFWDVQPGETLEGRNARIAEWGIANPGMAKFTQGVQQYFANSPLGLLQNKLAPQVQQQNMLSNIMSSATGGWGNAAPTIGIDALGNIVATAPNAWISPAPTITPEELASPSYVSGGGGGSDYSSYSGAGDSQTAASLSADSSYYG